MDAHALRTMEAAVHQLNFEPYVCSTAEEALSILNRRKFEAVVVDCDGIPGAPIVLSGARTGKSGKKCIVFALLNGGTTVQEAFQRGANFVLDKPLAPEAVLRSVRAANGLIMRERRRYRRYLLNASGTVCVHAMGELPVSVTNLSEGGISIECICRLEEGAIARLKVALPGSDKALELRGEVVWSTSDGRAGIRFQSLSRAVRSELESWIEMRSASLADGAVFINATAGSL
jgi:CheY-like chemotaxis protein